MSRSLSPETRQLLRAEISTAYYKARNDGRTMESAADAAVKAIEPIIASIDDNAHARGAAEATS